MISDPPLALSTSPIFVQERPILRGICKLLKTKWAFAILTINKSKQKSKKRGKLAKQMNEERKMKKPELEESDETKEKRNQTRNRQKEKQEKTHLRTELKTLHSSIVDNKCVCAEANLLFDKRGCNNLLLDNANKAKKRAASI